MASGGKLPRRTGPLPEGSRARGLPYSIVKRAADAEAGLVEDVGVDPGGGEAGVAQELLDSPEIVVAFRVR